MNTVVHAQCWAHTRRLFLKAEDSEPERTKTALEYIRRLYHLDAQLKERELSE